MPKRTGSELEEETDEVKRHNNNPSPKAPISADISTKMDPAQGYTELKRNMEEMKNEIQQSLDALSRMLGEVVITQNATTQATNFQSDFLEEVNEKCVDLQLKATKCERKMDMMSQSITGNETNIASARREIRQNTQDIKERNLVLNGIPELQNEVPLEAAIKFLKNVDDTVCKNDFETAYRMGRNTSKKGASRVLLVKFKFADRKQEFMKKKAAMKSKKKLGKVYCNDDLPEATRKVLQDMRDIASYALKIGYKEAKVSGNKLVIEGKVYHENELSTLPDNIKLENVKTRPIGNGIGFQSRHSYLSNFYACQIRINGKLFTSSEQAYQYQKAVICERDDTALSIKANNDPEEVKKLGDNAETCPEWESKKRAVMKCVVAHKFKQNPKLRAKLEGTRGMDLLECTTNRYWGTGRKLDSPLWNESNNFEGKNELGKILGEIRAALNPPPALNCTTEPNKVKKAEMNIQGVSETTVCLNPNKDSVHQEQQNDKSVSNYDDAIKPEHRPSHGTVPSAKELSSGIKATEIPAPTTNSISKMDDIVAGDEQLAPANLNRVESTVTQNESMELEGVDSVSLSSVFSDCSDNIDTKNLTLSDGRLDLEKIAGWKLHSLNTSRIASLSSRCNSESRKKYEQLIKTQNELSGIDLTTSTPKLTGNISTVNNRKKRKSVQQGHTGGEKGDLNNLLKSMNLI